MDTLIQNDHPVPNFTLPDLDGTSHTLEDYRGKVVILNFWSAECPHAQRVDQNLINDLKGWGNTVTLLSIASNANEPVEMLRRVSEERGLPLVLHDTRHQVADLYGAVTTPHLFVVDPQGILRYQGAPDDVTFRQRTPTRFYLRQAVKAVLAGQRPEPSQTPAYGCTIVKYAA